MENVSSESHYANKDPDVEQESRLSPRTPPRDNALKGQETNGEDDSGE